VDQETVWAYCPDCWVRTTHSIIEGSMVCNSCGRVFANVRKPAERKETDVKNATDIRNGQGMGL
jgi:ribosomal protein L37AE/L43A